MGPPGLAPGFALTSEQISGIMGSISIACWVIVFTPQLYENFRRQSAEGLSFTFVVLWLAGDLFNVLGALLQRVLPTMIILAIYYTLADIVLLLQCVVYHRRNSTKVDPSHLSPATPLLGPPEDDTVIESSTYNAISPENETVDATSPKSVSRVRSVLLNLVAVLLVILAGILGWALSNMGSKHTDKPPSQPDNDKLQINVLGQIFGWICAVLYLGSRLPQILLNFTRKSCEGVSFLFFLFACLGNLTYVISILAADTSRQYLIINASWLAGSVGTLFLDMVIFVQFWLYNVL